MVERHSIQLKDNAHLPVGRTPRKVVEGLAYVPGGNYFAGTVLAVGAGDIWPGSAGTGVAKKNSGRDGSAVC